MAVYKRGEKYWFEFVFGGVRYRRPTKTGNKRAAREIEAAAKLALARGLAGIQNAPAPALVDFLPRVEDFITTTKADRPSTVAWYARQIKYLKANKQLASTPLDQITTETAATYARARGKTVSVATVNRGLATLRRALRLGVEWGVIAVAPRIRLLAGENSRKYVLPDAMREPYLDALRPDIRPVAELMLETGLRVGEALALRWSDVRLDQKGKCGSVNVRAEIAKSKKPRTIPLTRAGEELLLGLRRKGPMVFGAPPPSLSSAEHDHRRAARQLKLPQEFVLHGLRHTYLTRLGASGVDAFSLRAIAGHASVTTSQLYVHPMGDALEAAVRRLDAVNIPTIVPTAAKKTARAKSPKRSATSGKLGA